jgi:hypothetical protein
MNMLYRNIYTMEVVNATIRTIKGKLIAVINGITLNCNMQMEEERFYKLFTKINGKDELSEVELVKVNKYFK